MTSDLVPSASGLARPAAAAMLLGVVTVIGGAILWSTANGGSIPGTVHHAWERGLIMAAIVLTAVGMLLLARHLRGTAGAAVVLAGATAYAAAGVLGLVQEAGTVSLAVEVAPWVLPVYVVGAFLGQATVGLGLAQAPGFAAWIGWIVLVWNLAWLVILPIASPGDLYFPLLHHVVLPAIAIPLMSHR